MGPNNTEQKLLDKIRSLPPEKVAEVGRTQVLGQPSGKLLFGLGQDLGRKIRGEGGKKLGGLLNREIHVQDFRQISLVQSLFA